MYDSPLQKLQQQLQINKYWIRIKIRSSETSANVQCLYMWPPQPYSFGLIQVYCIITCTNTSFITY